MTLTSFQWYVIVEERYNQKYLMEVKNCTLEANDFREYQR